MTEVRIGSATAHLVLRSAGSDGWHGSDGSVVAELVASGLRAERSVVHSGAADLADFFDHLAQDWRGWDGVRSWTSLEGDLQLEARYGYRHVQLRVTLRARGPGWGNDGWVSTAALTLDPGEQVSQVAADLRHLALPSDDAR